MEVNKNNLSGSQDYQVQAEKLRNSYDNELNNLRETHKNREATQREVYLKQKNEMEEQSAENIKEHEKKLRKEITTRQERYLKSLEAERSKFISDRNKTMEDNNFRMNSLKGSYQTAAEETEKLHDTYRENLEDRFTTGLSRREKDFNGKLNKIKRTNDTEMGNFRDSQNLEKRYIQSENANEKKKLIQETSLVRNQANSRHQLEKERLRQNQGEALQAVKSNADSQIKNILDNKHIEQEKQRANYERITENINQRNADAFRAANTESKNDKRHLEQQFADNRVDMQQKIYQAENKPLEKQYKQSKAKIEENWRNRVDHLKANIDDVQQDHNQQVSKMVADQKAIVRRLDTDSGKKLEEKDGDLRRVRREEIGKLRDEFQNVMTVKNKQVRQIEDHFADRETKIKREEQHNTNRQRDEFNRQINKLTDDKVAVVSGLRDDFAREKTDFIEKVRRDVHLDKEEMKSGMVTQFERREKALADKITMQDKDKEKIINSYEKQITSIKKKNAKELERYKILQNDIRLEDQRAARRDVLRLKQSYESEKVAAQADFGRKLDRAKGDADVHIAKLTERYENMLSNERGNHQRELQRRVSLLQDEMKRFQQQAASEKEALKAQHDIKLSKIEKAHRIQRDGKYEAKKPV